MSNKKIRMEMDKEHYLEVLALLCRIQGYVLASKNVPEKLNKDFAMFINSMTKLF